MRRLVAVLAVVPASLVLSVVSKGSGNSAEAKPEYAKKEGRECAYCHKNPKGAGPLNDMGDVYKKNKHSFPPEPKGFGEGGAFSNEANAKLFEFVKKAIEFGHFPETFKRLTELKAKEKKPAGAQLLVNTERQTDAKGAELARLARDAVQGGRVPEAAEALIRAETEFKGREAAKDVVKVRVEFAKLVGAKEADTAARLVESQRMLWLDAQMREAEARKSEAIKALTDLCTKHPDGPFTADAKKKLQDLGGIIPAPPAMGP